MNMVRFFCRFLREALGVPDSAMTVRLNVYTGNGLTMEEIEDRWLNALGLDRRTLRKHTVNHFPTSSSGRKLNKLPLGVCALRAYDTRLVQHIYGAIQEYGGFDEPRWLDGPPIKSQAGRQRRAARSADQ
jgi:DNA-binding transcriptional ArsR family regulator